MRRRDFITLLGGAAAARPLAAHAQQGSMPVIGYLSNGSPEVLAARVRSFRQGLAATGVVEGRDAAIEFRWAEYHTERLPELATELVRRGVNVLAAPGSTPATLAAKAATATIPIVFFVGSDPVDVGLVASLNRPGGNVTGVTNLAVEIGPKRLELLHELMPKATVFALAVNPATPLAETDSRSLLQAARVLGLELHVLRASSERDFNAVFSSLTQLHASALMFANDGLFTSRTDQLAALALHHATPAISPNLEFVAAGGLMSYGGSITEGYRVAGAYVGRILKGAKPADLPVQQATKIELAINLKTAKAFGITIPITLLGRADEIIE
jgi:putative ABC transport system substrate-binding protein